MPRLVLVNHTILPGGARSGADGTWWCHGNEKPPPEPPSLTSAADRSNLAGVKCKCLVRRSFRRPPVIPSCLNRLLDACYPVEDRQDRIDMLTGIAARFRPMPQRVTARPYSEDHWVASTVAVPGSC